MKVGNLRDCNVAVHLNLNSKREQIPDLPAIYLLCNIIIYLKSCFELIMIIDEARDDIYKRIAEDALHGLYDYFFISFCKQIS